MPAPRPSRQSISRILWFLLGGLCLGLGALGALLPVMPTTPFIIAAAFAFGKSSPRLRAWLLGHRLFGPMIRDWEASGTIDPRYKRMAYALMGLAFGASVIAGVKPIVLIIQAICMGSAALYVATRPIPNASQANPGRQRFPEKGSLDETIAPAGSGPCAEPRPR